mmetsp:Transcript_153313/g.266726  ORF Transcript_153313/g.266726 Transcript_153313/m.266726 type:complete len:464 (-) Transcript_153313:127-1518(-)
MYLYVFCEKSSSSMLVGSLIYMGNLPFAITFLVAPLMGLTLDNLVEGFRIKMFPEDMDIELKKALEAQKTENSDLIKSELKESGVYEVAPGFSIDETWTQKYYKMFFKHCVYKSNFGFYGTEAGKHFQLFHTDQTGARVAKCVAPLFLIIGIGWLAMALKVASSATFEYGSACEAQGDVCELEVTLEKDMVPPIWVLYKVDPFYQNYKIYADSYSMMELKGLNATAKDLLHCADSPTAMKDNATGKEFAPCGLISASVFNDTFSFSKNKVEFAIDMSGIARPSEVGTGKKSLFNNPDGYPDDKFSWLYERYPGVISEESGVRDEKFAVWNRISASNHVTKPYGKIINETLYKGSYTLRIDNRFNPGPNAEKYVVLMKETMLGGDDASFGYLMLFFSFLSLSFGCYATYAKQSERRITAEEAFVMRGRSGTGVLSGTATASTQLTEPLIQQPGAVQVPDKDRTT